VLKNYFQKFSQKIFENNFSAKVSFLSIHLIHSFVANIYLIESKSGIVIIDAGFSDATRAVLRRIEELGHASRDVRLIFLTHVHMDHVGSAAELKRATGAPIAVHRADLEKARAGEHNMPKGRGMGGKIFERAFNGLGLKMSYEPFEGDIFLEDGDTLKDFGLDARVIHTPGHTLGSLSLGLEDGAMLVGDAMINQIRVGKRLNWRMIRCAR